MPHKEPRSKKEWERLHRPQRLARRRELRRIEAARKEAQPETAGRVSFLFPVVAGGALAAYNPKLAMGAGGLTLIIAAVYKKGWSWWIVDVLIFLLGVFFYWSDQSAENSHDTGKSAKQKRFFPGSGAWNDPQTIFRRADHRALISQPQGANLLVCQPLYRLI